MTNPSHNSSAVIRTCWLYLLRSGEMLTSREIRIALDAKSKRICDILRYMHDAGQIARMESPTQERYLYFVSPLCRVPWGITLLALQEALNSHLHPQQKEDQK